jgi:hypothetical protein
LALTHQKVVPEKSAANSPVALDAKARLALVEEQLKQRDRLKSFLLILSDFRNGIKIVGRMKKRIAQPSALDSKTS